MLILNSIIILTSINPVKIRLNILIFRILIFISIGKIRRRIWFPIIFLLLFVGGVIIIFIILSSLAPNEKSLKTHIKKFFIYTTTIMPWIIYRDVNSKIHRLKWIIKSNSNIEILIIIILGYFFSFILIIRTDKLSIRSM